MKKNVSDLGLEYHVDFKGFLPDPFNTVGETNLFLLNSFSEGFSNALAEAIDAGVPCLATQVGAADQLIKDGETGWLVQPDNDSELYKTLKHILSLNRNELEKVGIKGREYIRKNHSLNAHLKYLMKVYQN